MPKKAETPSVKKSISALNAKRKWRLGSWQLWLGILFSLVFLILALRGIDLKETVKVLGLVKLLFLAAAVFSFIASAFTKAIRWQLLLSVRNSPSFARVFSILSVGLMVNAFLPTRLGELARAYLMGEAEADSKVYVLGTIAVEKVSDILTLLLILALLLSQMTLPKWLVSPARDTALVFAFMVPCFILLVWQKNFILRVMERINAILPAKWGEWIMHQTRNGLAGLEIIRLPRILFGLIGMSLIVWTISALTNYLVLFSLGLVLPVWTSLLLLVVLQVGTAVPSSPGSIGIFQYLVILTLSIYAVDKNVALGYSILLYLVIFVPLALLGIWGLWHEKISWGGLKEMILRSSNGGKSG